MSHQVQTDAENIIEDEPEVMQDEIPVTISRLPPLRSREISPRYSLNNKYHSNNYKKRGNSVSTTAENAEIKLKEK